MNKISKNLNISHDRVRKVLSKNLDKLNSESLEKFAAEDCKGIRNRIGSISEGVCWAISSVQFLSSLFNELENPIEVMEQLCSRKSKGGVNTYGIYSLFFTITTEINKEYEQDLINIYLADNISKEILEEENFEIKQASYNENYVILFSLDRITFDELLEVPSEYSSEAFYFKVNDNHAICIRKCREEYFLFDDHFVMKLEFGPIDFMQNLNYLIELRPNRYRYMKCVAVLLAKD
jgi:hypothetical protein